MLLGFDFETASAASLANGAEAYAADPSTIVQCAVLALANHRAEVQREFEWVPGQPFPGECRDHIRKGGFVVAHNTTFERSVLAHCPDVADWPSIRPDQWIDTAKLAARFSLPASLEGMCKYLKVDAQKDEKGHELMLIWARSLDLGDGEYLHHTLTTRQRRRLLEYCRIDVLAMFSALNRLLSVLRLNLQGTESRIDTADEVINARGMHLDLELIASLQAVLAARKAEMGNEALAATSGEELPLASAPALKRFLCDYGIKLPKVNRVKLVKNEKGEVIDRVHRKSETVSPKALREISRDDLQPAVRAALRRREEITKLTSLAKVNKALAMTGPDGRLRNALRYCGAHTGRWASSGVQIHNMPKNKLSPEDTEAARQILLSTGSVKQRLARLHDLFVGENILWNLSQLLRSIVTAAPGHDLIAADYSAIEARVLAWLAGQDDVLRVFASGEDIYMADARGIGSNDRQLGKVQRLGLGYGMGDVKFADTAAGYGVTLPLGEFRRIKITWRERNPHIVTFWDDLEEAMRWSQRNPNKLIRIGKHLTASGNSRVFRIRLPSGRCLHYWKPGTRTSVRRMELVSDEGKLYTEERQSDEIVFRRPDGSRRRMMLDTTYGGKLAENVTQAVSRELLGNALLTLRPTSYKVTLHVHDSIVSEVPEGTGDVAEFEYLISKLPRWAEGLPVVAEGYRSPYFKG